MHVNWKEMVVIQKENRV